MPPGLPDVPVRLPCAATSRLPPPSRSEEHTSELQSQFHLVCRLLLEKKKILHLIDVCQRRNDFFEAKEIVRLMLTLFLFVIVSQRDCDLYRCSFTLACSVRLLPHVSP